MAKKITQKELKHDEFVDAAWDFGHWLEENWPTVVKAAVAVAVIGGIALFWFWYAGQRKAQGAVLLAEGLYREVLNRDVRPESSFTPRPPCYVASEDAPYH